MIAAPRAQTDEMMPIKRFPIAHVCVFVIWMIVLFQSNVVFVYDVQYANGMCAQFVVVFVLVVFRHVRFSR